MGAFAEVVAVREDYVVAQPPSFSDVESAALPLAGLTSWQALVEMGQLQAGQTVLIHGGTGGVGSIAIQIAKHLGATVATTVSHHNMTLARDLGADIVIDYRNEDFTTKVTSVDIVLDTQGGEVQTQSFTVLRPGGKLISISGPPDPEFAERVGANPAVKLAVRGLSSGARRAARKADADYRFLFVRPNGEHLQRVADLAASGAIRPIVDRTMPFSSIPEALETLLEGGHRGKIVVIPATEQ